MTTNGLRKTLLIDGDILAYKASLSNQKTIDWGDGILSVSVDVDEAHKYIDNLVAKLKRVLQASKVFIALSDPARNFRKELDATYKAKRSAHKPVALANVKDFMSQHYPTVIKPGLEADDVLGIWATHPTMIKGSKIIVTTDKDLLQIPGWHYNLDTDKKSKVSEGEADRFFLRQILTGDSVDNYPGCPGIGPKTADQILDADCSWDAVVAAYEKRGKTADDALAQARLARILRHTDFDYDKKEPILWTP